MYLIPETWDEQRVDLWRCRRFPDDWTRERTLLDGVSMSDPTLHRQDGKLWLFGTVSEVRARANDELHIYMADTLEGAWRPHPANPVVSDRGRARPAGRLFFRDGHLMRPGQDCYGRYGRAVVLNRIDELNERSYAEIPVGRIDGSWLAANAGVHYAQSRRRSRISGRMGVQVQISIPISGKPAPGFVSTDWRVFLIAP